MKTKRRELITVALVIGLIAVTAMAYMIYTNKFIGNKSITDNGNSSENRQALAEGETWTAETLKATVDTSTWNLNKVNIVESADGIPVPVPKGFFASELEGENTVLGGFVIYSGEEPIKGIRDEEGNLIEKLGSYDKTTNKLTSAYSTDPDSYWQASCNRNQWVWVPVPDISRIYEVDETTGKKKAKLWDYSSNNRKALINNDGKNPTEPGKLFTDKDYDNEYIYAKYNFQGLTQQKMSEQLQIEFEATINSIQKYGGFYIGRYETGNMSTISKLPVVRRMNTNLNHCTWYDSYNKLSNIEINEKVKVNIIWGCLWDETLQWLIETGFTTYNDVYSKGENWGYYRTPRQYTALNGSTDTTQWGFQSPIPAGSSEYCNANNIYDLSGNVSELTLGERRRESLCTFRGGFNFSATGGDSPSMRMSAYPNQDYAYYSDGNGNHGLRC